ncbi:MAG TPA: hypothetical protein VIG45_06200, partial [Erysipelothrix sp.]
MEREKIRKDVLFFFNKNNIVLTDSEAKNIEIADFGLNNLDTYGLQLVTYVNNDRYCAKEMVLFPNQICPEHRHPKRLDGTDGKQETFRCRFGEVHLFVEGNDSMDFDQ